MICFDRIVRVPLDVVPRRRHQLVKDGGVDRGGVGYHLARGHLQHRQGALEEPASRVCAAAGRQERVNDLSVLVYGSVDVAPDTVDLDIGRVDQPSVAWRTSSEPGYVCQKRSEAPYSPKDRDVVDLNPTLDQEFLKIAV
jgi:hypothetical protein